MTPTNTQPKWALIGVRVCAVYLAGVTAFSILVFLPSTIGSEDMKFLFVSGVFFLITFKLWQLRYWALLAARVLLIGQLFTCINALFVSRTLATVTLLWLIVGLFALIALIYLFMPFVHMLFQNQQSSIRNPKS